MHYIKNSLQLCLKSSNIVHHSVDGYCNIEEPLGRHLLHFKYHINLSIKIEWLDTTLF